MPRRSARHFFITMRRFLTAFSPIVWTIIAMFTVLAVWYGTATPLFEKPDEQWHFAFAMYMVETGQLPVQTLGERGHLAEQEGSQPPLYYATLAGVLKVLGYTDLQPGFRALTEVNPYYGGRLGAWRDNGNQFVHTPCRTEACERTAQAVYIGRGLSIIFGIVALLAAAYAVRLAFPENPVLPWLTTAIIAFIPQFLHIASSVSNDVATVAFVNLVIVFVLLWLRTPRWQWAAVAGVSVGGAILGKVSGVGIGIIIGLVLLLVAQLPWRTRLLHLSVYGAAVLGTTGWWLWRNVLLYGEPTATAIHLEVYGTPPNPLTWHTFRAEWQAIINSFWASFGWGSINPDPWAYTLVQWLVAISAVLFVLTVVRRWRGWTSLQRTFVLIAVGQLLLIGFLHFRWMRLTVAPLGRLLYPALLPIAFMVALGVVSWLSPRIAKAVAAGYATLWVGVAIAMPILLIMPAYALPPVLSDLPPSATPVHAQFGDFITLEGYEVPTDPVPLGSEVPITLYWRTTQPVSDQLSVSYKFFGRENELLVEYNSYPDGGRAPTTGWLPDTLITDYATLVLTPTAVVPTLGALEIDLFDHDTLRALPVVLEGQTVRPFRPATIIVRNNIPAPAAFSGFAPLLSSVHLTDTIATLLLTWQVGAEFPARPYQAFLHLTPAIDQPPLVAADFPPLRGSFPTAYWLSGDLLEDETTLLLPTDVPRGEYVIVTGLYDPETQQRVAGVEGQTAWVLTTLVWDGSSWTVKE